MKNIILLFAITIFLFGCSKDEPVASSCPKLKNLGVSDLTNTAVNFTWNGFDNASLYQVEYGELGFALGTGTSLSAPNPYANVTDLLPQTQYAFYARVYCNADQKYSDWSGPYVFITLEHNQYCDNPSNLSVSLYSNAVSHNHVILNWADADFDGVQVEYGAHGFVLGNGTIKIVDYTVYPTSVEIDNLQADTSYDFYIRNQCDTAGFSDWIGPLVVDTLSEPYNENCLDPVNFTLDEIYTTSGSDHLVFSWDALNGETTWQLHQVVHGNTFDSGSTLDTSYNPIHLTNYTTNGVEYDFYVKSNCSTDGYSGWVGPITIVGP